MRILAYLATLISLLPSVLAAPSSTLPARYAVHERRAAEPLHWHLSRRANPSSALPLNIGLRQQNIENIEEMLMAVSHPSSPTYGQHWSAKQVVETFSPTNETIGSVLTWLMDSGFSSDKIRVSGNRGWVQLHATIAEIEELLHTEYHVYTHLETGEEQIGCKTYSLPVRIQEHVDLIRPTVHFNHHPSPAYEVNKRFGGLGVGDDVGPTMSPKKVQASASSDSPGDLSECDSMTTLDCLRALYNINYTPVATDKNTFGVVEFTPQAFLEADLDLFFANFSPSQVGTRPVTVLIDGAVVQTDNQAPSFNVESDLDLEYAMGLTTPQPVTLLQVGDLVEGGSFDNWLDAVDASFCTFEGGDDPSQDGIYPDTQPGGFDGPEDCGILPPPNVVSISYAQDESSVTPAFAMRQCAEHAKLGLMGSSVFYSSGDRGVAGNGNVCLDNDGTPDANGVKFNPQFPATCPFVTAVGATQINPGSTVSDPEVACMTRIFSGGGFSNIYSLPDYQSEAVSSYLTNNPPPFTAQRFNNSGNSRAIPDISANGANYVVAVNGEFRLVFGTSASAPVVASIITLVNDARIAAGKKPVGFINPAIYSDQFKNGLNDITTGDNPGCGSNGFSAAVGWDPVTGVGTPNLANLIPLFLNLP
ncbi:subtilisin-like protein [Dendrothele bispora CBS 962.96]|uniref:tripeptidyl-peptidase II n=1 Tax=Dendrothele bispora (strain CBS 962.96) TaxID=1314807 RepID=A0A4S8L295_DENBC|nr:subtilisin-like protein [Dendrothele bispora CBS 962.96]